MKLWTYVKGKVPDLSKRWWFGQRAPVAVYDVTDEDLDEIEAGRAEKRKRFLSKFGRFGLAVLAFWGGAARDERKTKGNQ